MLDLCMTTSLKPLLLYDHLSSYLAPNPILQACTKHIELDHHFLRNYLLMVHSTLFMFSSQDQLGHDVAKPLGTCQFQMLRVKLLVFP